MPNIFKGKIKNILITLFLGLILRMININQSLWLDEAISVQAVKTYSLSALLSQFMLGDFNPPLFNLILYFWLKLFPATEFFIRLPSVIFGILTCWTIYKIYDLIFKDKKSAFFSLVFLATSPLHIFYSQEARMYSLAAFTTSASMYYFLKMIKEKKLLFTIYYLLFTTAMMYSHYLAWLILPVQWIYFFLSKSWKSKKTFITLSLYHFIALSLFIPWLPMLFKQLNVGQRVARENLGWHQVVGGLSLKSIILLPVKFIIGRTSFDNKLLYCFIASLLILFFGFLLYQACKNKKHFSRSRLGLERLIWLWLIVPPSLGIIISFKIPIFSYFRFLFCLPAFYFLIAKGIFSLRQKKSRFSKIPIFLLLLINLFFTFRYLFNQDYHRENWKEAVKTLHQENVNGIPVLIIQSVSAPFDFYDRGVSKKVFVYQKDAVANFETVWLIPYAQPIFDPRDETRTFLESNDFARVYEEHFRGVTLEKWQKLLAES